VRTDRIERAEAAPPAGGAFLLSPGDPAATAKPETLSAEQVDVRDAVRAARGHPV